MSVIGSMKPPKYISANQPEFITSRSYCPCAARTELRCFSSEPANGLTSRSTLLPVSFSYSADSLAEAVEPGRLVDDDADRLDGRRGMAAARRESGGRQGAARRRDDPAACHADAGPYAHGGCSPRIEGWRDAAHAGTTAACAQTGATVVVTPVDGQRVRAPGFTAARRAGGRCRPPRPERTPPR